jgi:FkbM family methyltransferase
MYHSIVNNWKKCKIGWSLRDQLVCFLLAIFSGLGLHRRLMRALLPWVIGWSSTNRYIRLRLKINGQSTIFSLRKDDLADYLIAGEMIRGVEHAFPGRPPARIIDAGANIGAFMVLAARTYPDVPLICYEPGSANFELLQKNANDNGLKVDLRRMGVWSKSCNLYFHAQASYNGYMSELENELPAISCELPDAGQDTWLKIDAEGAEYEVLPAMFQNRSFPYHISLELHHRNVKHNDLVSLSRQHGYSVEGDTESTSDCINLTLQRTADVD